MSDKMAIDPQEEVHEAYSMIGRIEGALSYANMCLNDPERNRQMILEHLISSVETAIDSFDIAVGNPLKERAV